MIAVLLPALIGTGCYRYVPANETDIAPNADVRLRLNADEANRLAGAVTAGTRVIEGRVIEEQQDSVLLLVSVFSELQGTRVVNLSQRMHVARGGILDVEARTLDRTRTTLVAVGAGVGIGALVALIVSGGFNSESDRDDIPPSDLIVPLFRLRW